MTHRPTISQIQTLLKGTPAEKLNPHVFDLGGEKKKRSKYGNKPVEVDGIWFQSQKEANRYVQLRFLKNAGEISELQLQVQYELNEGGSHSYKYVADFVYRNQYGELVVEDVKGFRTRDYKKKRRLMKEVYGIDIREI